MNIFLFLFSDDELLKIMWPEGSQDIAKVNLHPLLNQNLINYCNDNVAQLIT